MADMHSMITKRILLSCILAGMLTPVALSQGAVAPERITRSKLWMYANPNGSLERDQSMRNTWLLAYPGYSDHNNEASGGWDNQMIYQVGSVGGEKAGWKFRNGNFDDGDIYAIVQTTLTKNYNLRNRTLPEEVIKGSIGSVAIKDGKRHMSFRLDGEIYAWSLPQYDDFLIIKCRLTSTEAADTIKDYYYVRYLEPNGPYRPSSVSNGWDQEYLWDNSISPDVGFIFFDDTSIPATGGAPPTYNIHPGNITGNAGDPGNIGVQGSRDFKLYSPSLYAFSFVPSTLTPNKNGQQKVWRSIVSSNSTAPASERHPFPVVGNEPDLDVMKAFLDGHQQPEVSWRNAYDANQANPSSPPYPLGGSLWERNPAYFYGIGPYDIPPGGSIEWVEIFICGQMDRNVTMRGDTAATLHFVAEGLKNLKDNWTSAQALMSNNYVVGTGEVPPPTPADAPRVGNATELLVEPALEFVGGNPVVGVTVTWNAVHRGYRDPFLLRSDFEAYKLYRSDNSIEGPWRLLETIPWTRADSFYVSGSIKYFVQAPGNVPYRYCVTSVDSSGNESGMTGYSFYPVAAEPEPTNNQSNILVVPNPFKQVSGFPDQQDNKRLAFVNIPSKCTIRIYTVALDLVKTIEHDGGGIKTWGSQGTRDYMLTDFGQNVMPGVYVFHVESHVPGHEGESSVGKFVVIK